VRLLLDTHIFFWAATDDPQLPGDVRTVLLRPSNQLVVSVASVWEMSIKSSSGRWPAAAPMLDDLDEAIASLDAQLLPITAPHAVSAGRLPWSHRDPFDRMLAAQSIVDDMALVTVDRAFDDSGARLLGG
jgi:PIN domain nuclease of toxin-antitoxin system